MSIINDFLLNKGVKLEKIGLNEMLYRSSTL